MSAFVVPNPKIYADNPAVQERKIYPYYAGYSSVFAEAALRALGAESGSVVLDPWNGSGTTTAAAHKMGCKVVGLDLNPVMVLVAKAQMVCDQKAAGILASFCDAYKRHDDLESFVVQKGDPLLAWLSPSSVECIRSLESAVRNFVEDEVGAGVSELNSVASFSPCMAFVYVALFRCVRALLVDFVPSNPTWVKKPRTLYERKRPSAERIFGEFLRQFETLVGSLKNRGQMPGAADGGAFSIVVGNSDRIPLDRGSVDFVVTSPPYCTRIDYAVATSIELAVLGLDEGSFSRLRRSLMGSTTVSSRSFDVNENWGKTCLDFLGAVSSHPAKASATYYYKSHVQYFDSLYRSVEELSRVLKVGGRLVMVVQDSHYKELRNDLALIVSEMASTAGLTLTNRTDFDSGRSMAQLNLHVRRYRSSGSAVESVLCFEKGCENGC